MEKISNDYRENVRVLDGLLGVGRSCDMVSRDYLIGGRRARLWVVDGFGSDSILERMGAFWLTLKPENVVGLTEMQDFLDRYITFSESNVTFDISDAVTSVFLGKSLLAVEGLAGVALMDAKGYPSRSVHEPPDGKVLRGSHDGFVEAVVPNMALLRRRIRDPHLTMEGHKVGSRTHNDAVLCYLDDKVDQDLLRKLRGKLLGLDVRSLTMAQESLAEAIRPKQWYNPFPKVRYTERPDAAAASIMEGSIVLMVDNSPSVMILPTGFFDFTQESNDYYFPPLGGHLSPGPAGNGISPFFIYYPGVVSHGQRTEPFAGVAELPVFPGAGVFEPAESTSGGGISHRRIKAGVPEHTGQSFQFLFHAGSLGSGGFCRAGRMAGAGGAGVYGLRVRGGVRPAQLRAGLRLQTAAGGAAVGDGGL